MKDTRLMQFFRHASRTGFGDSAGLGSVLDNHKVVEFVNENKVWYIEHN